MNSNTSWLFTAIYTSPKSAERHILWNNLNKVTDLHDMPWVITGDCNDTLTAEDKFGGRAVGVNSLLRFKECLDNCNMIDIGFSRLRFTWTNKREIQALIQVRLDRFVFNPRERQRPFKFQTCWLTNPTFSSIVTQAWRQPCNLGEAIKHFTKEATDWNKQHFGNIFVKKKNILVRLKVIQHTVSVKPSTFLLNLEKELVKEFDTILS
ncbi:uncharacterized protein LOC112024885 [Quercus suber]|uniref:uncharacterized protein LOC112024885 n=1 Tax=Quercus suber TaxID=58331 RepID=UPI000CE1A559|nr:uncharacterized protein LOC112024885 [Quercus suber]